jgi:Flp pilus assembly protein TadG
MKTTCKYNRSSRAAGQRHGAATVEFALCAPIFFLLVFAGIELSRTNMLIHTVDAAALQGARRGIVSGATAPQCIQAAQNVLNVGKVTTATVSVSPTTITDGTRTISVTVSVPIDGNLYLTPQFFGGRSIQRTTTVNREM